MESLLEIIKEYLGEAVVAIVTGLVAYLSGKSINSDSIIN